MKISDISFKEPVLMGIIVSAVLLLLISSFSISSGAELTLANVIRNFAFNIPSFIVMGYFDYKIIKSGWLRRNLVADLAVTSILVAVFCIIISLLIHAATGKEIYLVRNIFCGILTNIFIVIILEIFLYIKQKSEDEQRLALLEKEKALYQYNALKNQINPHFLFNSLNVLASLAYTDADKTNLFTKKLSAVYRYLLTTSDRTAVPLTDELQFVASYLYLERIRFGDSLHTEIINSTAGGSHQIVPVAIQMLCENAIKHNICTTTRPLEIKIECGDCQVTVTNNLHLRPTVQSNGMGLKNLRQQYRLQGMDITVTNNGTSFSVTIPYLE